MENVRKNVTVETIDYEKRRIGNWRLANIVVAGACSILCFVLFLYTVLSGNDPDHHLMSYLGSTLLFSSLTFTAAKFKKIISDYALTVILAFFIFAIVGGSFLMLYSKVSFYDKVMHTSFGYIGCLVGLYLICKTGDHKKLQTPLIIIFCFAMSLACGAVWEIFEFSADGLFGQTAQGIKQLTINSEYITDVSDTVFDLICNFAGAVVFTVHYIIHKITGKNLLLNSLKEDFSKKI